MFHQQSSQVIHPQSSQVTHQQSSQAPVVSLQSSADHMQSDSCLVIPYFLSTDDPLESFYKALSFICTTVASFDSLHINQLETLSDPVYQDAMQERQTLSCVDSSSKSNDEMASKYTHLNTLAILTDARDKVNSGPGAYTVFNNEIFQSDNIYSNDSDCDEVLTAQATFMASLSNHNSDVLSEVPYTETYQNDMGNQSVQAMQYFEQTPIVDLPDNEITSDSNIIPYSKYLQETQQATVQDTNLQAQQDAMILSVIKHMSKQMINRVNN
ncbi:hypothetical protein Tco_0957549 [Tanacetum coccineum]